LVMAVGLTRQIRFVCLEKIALDIITDMFMKILIISLEF
jgi:hypothetical protein